MRPSDISSLRRKFEDGITNILEEAKRRKSGFFGNGLPWWGWALLLFFGFDDLMRWVKSKWIIPILIVAGAYFLLNKLNMTSLPRNVYYDIEEKYRRVYSKITGRRSL